MLVQPRLLTSRDMQCAVSLVYYVGPAQTADESRYTAYCDTGLLCCSAQTADESKYAAYCVTGWLCCPAQTADELR